MRSTLRQIFSHLQLIGRYWPISLVLFFFVLGARSSLSSESPQLPSLNLLALECFRSSQIGPCQRALLQSEALQRRAGAKKNYPCQTLVIGLGADLIMSELHEGRGLAAVEMLEDVNELCRGL